MRYHARMEYPSKPSFPYRPEEGDGEWCPYGEHEWIWDRHGDKPLIVPSFVGGRAGTRMVQVRCTKCGVVTRADMEEYLRDSRFG